MARSVKVGLTLTFLALKEALTLIIVIVLVGLALMARSVKVGLTLIY